MAMKVRRKVRAEMVAGDSLESLGGRLQALRHLRDVTQLALAEVLGVGQTALSHAERRNDALLSTLNAYVEALGGQLHVAATFPNGDVVPLIGGANWEPTSGNTADVETNERRQLCLFNILDSEQPSPSRDVIFSVRPVHAEKILDGTKTVELRRRFTGGVRPGALALIYATSPTSALTGFARIQDVQRLALRDLWEKHRTGACLRKAEFETYFSGLENGYAIVLNSAKSLRPPVGLHELRQRFGFEPPQSYQYASSYMRGLVERDQSQAPH